VHLGFGSTERNGNTEHFRSRCGIHVPRRAAPQGRLLSPCSDVATGSAGAARSTPALASLERLDRDGSPWLSLSPPPLALAEAHGG